jgi:hypothetical protein
MGTSAETQLSIAVYHLLTKEEKLLFSISVWSKKMEVWCFCFQLVLFSVYIHIYTLNVIEYTYTYIFIYTVYTCSHLTCKS